MKIKEIIQEIEKFAPLHHQESYDNSGVQVGNTENKVSGILIAFDITEETVDEAIKKNCNLIVSHHPLIFRGIKKITGSDYIQRCIIKAIKNDVCIYSAHTNLDKAQKGVSFKTAEKIGLKNIKPLVAEKEQAFKIITFIPNGFEKTVTEAMFNAGAGTLGNYKDCSFASNGTGTFTATEGCNPYIGKLNEKAEVAETRVEMIVSKNNLKKAINALIKSHPYEEPAYDIIKLENDFYTHGLGVIGELETETDTLEYLKQVKETLGGCPIRHTVPTKDKIKKVALCGGAGAEMISNAVNAGADLYISGDFKYHQFFEAEKRIVIVDAGHFETEQFTKEIFFDIISKISSKFAVHLAEYKTNPINYL